MMVRTRYKNPMPIAKRWIDNSTGLFQARLYAKSALLPAFLFCLDIKQQKDQDLGSTSKKKQMFSSVLCINILSTRKAGDGKGGAVKA